MFSEYSVGKGWESGVVNSGEGTAFVDAVTAHRHWTREV
jgi:hypothetical protein